MNIVEEFSQSGHAAWKLDPESYKHNLAFEVFQKLEQHPDVILVMSNAESIYLLNRNYIRVKVVTRNGNDVSENGTD